MSQYLVANRHKTTEEEEKRGLRPRCAGLVLWVGRSDVITSGRRLTSGEAASGFLDGHCSKRGCNKQQDVAASLQDQKREPRHAGADPPVLRAGAEEQGGGADGDPLPGAEDHGGLSPLQPGPPQRRRPPQRPARQIRGHTHRGGGEDQGQASGAVGHHQSPPPGRVPPAGPPGGPGRQLLPLHQRLLRGGGGRLRPRLCPRDAGPHRPDGVQRPRRLLGGGAGEDQRAVLRVDKAGRHLGGRHRAVHPVQVLPVRDLRGGHADGARGPLRRGRGLPEARAAHLRRHPLRPAAEGAARLRRPAPHHLLHQRRRHPGPGPGAGRRRPPQAPVHRRQPLRSALPGVPDGPGGTEGGAGARQGDGPHQLWGGVSGPPPLLPTAAAVAPLLTLSV